MSRLQQNIVYMCLLASIIGFFWVLYPCSKYTPCVIYLPQRESKNSPVNVDLVSFYASSAMDLEKSVPARDGNKDLPSAIIRVATHLQDPSELRVTCDRNILEAKRKAAENGLTKIIGNCVYSSKNSPLDTVNLYSYAYS